MVLEENVLQKLKEKTISGEFTWKYCYNTFKYNNFELRRYEDGDLTLFCNDYFLNIEVIELSELFSIILMYNNTEEEEKAIVNYLKYWLEEN